MRAAGWLGAHPPGWRHARPGGWHDSAETSSNSRRCAVGSSERAFQDAPHANRWRVERFAYLGAYTKRAFIRLLEGAPSFRPYTRADVFLGGTMVVFGPLGLGLPCLWNDQVRIMLLHRNMGAVRIAARRRPVGRRLRCGLDVASHATDKFMSSQELIARSFPHRWVELRFPNVGPAV